MTRNEPAFLASMLEHLGQLMKAVPDGKRAAALPCFVGTALYCAEKEIAARAA
jgi:hypothetical protein